MTGFETALNEITLVLFTTLAPSGVVAYCLMAVALLRAEGDGAKRLNAMLLLPFLVCLGGLVASATHLGNPDNALYVFARVGRSPLSMEVFAAVLFLGAAGLQWLYQFAEHARSWLHRVLLVAALVAGAAFLAAIAMAYSSRTVVTWDTPLVPLALVLNAFVGGPLLALAGFTFCGSRLSRGGAAAVLLMVSFGALAAATVVYSAQFLAFADLANGTVSVAQLAPHYDLAIVAFAALCLMAIVLDGAVLVRARRIAQSSPGGEGKADRASAAQFRFVRIGVAAAAALAFAGIFVMRFMFYMTHMTVGISL